MEGERGEIGRICVFNGPLFNEDDPQFGKRFEVALSFYKVVVWYDVKGTLYTTCYTLSQEKLVGQIDFVEVLRFDEVFKTSQVPIHQIQDITGLQHSIRPSSRPTPVPVGRRYLASCRASSARDSQAET